MILYLDASALVKRYVIEDGSREVDDLIAQADFVGTGLISRAEVVAALAKAARMNVLTKEDALAAVKTFRVQWNDFIRLQVNENLIAKADALAWEYGLRGYDAVHLASALMWQDTVDESITVATYDQQLAKASQHAGLRVYPES